MDRYGITRDSAGRWWSLHRNGMEIGRRESERELRALLASTYNFDGGYRMEYFVAPAPELEGNFDICMRPVAGGPHGILVTYADEEEAKATAELLGGRQVSLELYRECAADCGSVPNQDNCVIVERVGKRPLYYCTECYDRFQDELQGVVTDRRES